MKLDELIACRNLLVHMATDRYYEVSLTAPLESEYDVEAYELFGTIQDPRKVADNITEYFNNVVLFLTQEGFLFDDVRFEFYPRIYATKDIDSIIDDNAPYELLNNVVTVIPEVVYTDRLGTKNYASDIIHSTFINRGKKEPEKLVSASYTTNYNELFITLRELGFDFKAKDFKTVAEYIKKLFASEISLDNETLKELGTPRLDIDIPIKKNVK